MIHIFTGIIEELGVIRDFNTNGNSGVLAVEATRVCDGTKIGDSIAVNGICLTVTALTDYGFTADVMAETLRRSGLKKARRGDKVNLERAMAATDRFGGHIVSGHIDGTGTIRGFTRDENAVWVEIAASSDIMSLIVEKGSVAIDGISLTVAKVNKDSFEVSVIPHTAQETTLIGKKINDLVNLENDMVGKYVRKLMGMSKENEKVKASSSRLTMEMLMEYEME